MTHDDGSPDVYAARGQAFIDHALAAPPPPMLIEHLIPAQQTLCVFGPPRSRKTWLIEDVLVSLATGTPALGNERFRVTTTGPVLYVTNEDGAHSVAMRVRALLAGRGIDRCPDHFHFRVRQGTWFDAQADQDRHIAEILREGYIAVADEPLRSLTGCVDKGPADFAPFGKFLRDLMTHTKTTLILGHHTTKPKPNEPDTRSLPDRMSGGGLFSYVDAPLSLERVDDTRTLVTPTFWKHSPDPLPVLFTLATNDTQRPTIANLTSELAGSDNAKETALQGRILDFLRHNSAQSSNKVAAGVRASKQGVQQALDALAERGRVDRTEGLRGAYLWFVTGTGSEPVPEPVHLTGSTPKGGTSQWNQSTPMSVQNRSMATRRVS